MKFFDLHCHPSFKPIFSRRYTPWDEINTRNFLLAPLIRSQGNLQQFISNNQECNLLCISLYAPETAFVNNWLIELSSLFTTAMNKNILDDMGDATIAYKDEINQEIVSLLHGASNPRNTKCLHILKSFTEYDANNTNNLYIFFSVEGGHAFYGDRNHDGDLQTILVDLEKFINGSTGLVFYITPCHLTPNIFLTHAYGNKLLAKGRFIPNGTGITKEGRQFLDEMILLGQLIDVKHMSLISRQELYATSAWMNKPLLCSHAGVTGISWEDKLEVRRKLFAIKKGPKFFKVRYHKPDGILPATYFNPCSINLYNEDIENILSTGGLIGITMDLRIIGGDRTIIGRLKLREKEFVSEAEFEQWLRQQSTAKALKRNDYAASYSEAYNWVGNEISDEIWDREDREDEYEELNSLTEDDIHSLFSKSLSVATEKFRLVLFKDRSKEHLRFFVNQIFHIVKVAQKAVPSIDPWKHICLGTDFDGFIRSIDCCKNAAKLETFATLLQDEIEGLANEASVTLPQDRSITKLVEDIFFNNAYDFLKSHCP